MAATILDCQDSMAAAAPDTMQAAAAERLMCDLTELLSEIA
jgi:hypothetical protein